MVNLKTRQIRLALPQKATRRLAAILFTDIEGYTALMQENEPQALAELNRFRETLTQRAGKFSGEIIQYYGDGCLMLFVSSLDAVGFAKTVQEDFRKDPPLTVRIGIHAGDVILKDGFVFGDNVNLASRIESLGVSGSVLLSQTVRNQITNQAELTLAPLGPFHFKNVKEPMELFALATEGFPVPLPEEMEGKLKTKTPKDLVAVPTTKLKSKLGSLSILLVLLTGVWYFLVRPSEESKAALPWENSIAILPFDNLNHDPEKEYLSIGVADEIRAELTSIPKLKVISRSSCMYYRDKDYPLKQIGQELQAAYILEGTVQQADGELKISVQLSNASTDQVEWSPVFARKMEDIFSIQEEIALEVANKLQLDLTEKEKEALKRKYDLSSTTYDLYLKAVNQISLMTTEGLNTGEDLLVDVIHLAEGYPVAYANMAWMTIFKDKDTAGFRQDSARQKADYYIEKAKKIDPETPQLHSVQAAIAFYFDWDIGKAESEARQAIAAGDPQGTALLVDILIRTNRIEEAGLMLHKALEKDPLNVELITRQGQIYLADHENLKSFASFEKALRIDSLFEWAINGLATLDIRSGKFRQAKLRLELQKPVSGAKSMDWKSIYAIACYQVGEHERSIKILKELQELWDTRTKAGIAFSMARAYAGMGMSQKALDWLKLSYHEHEPAMMDLLYEPFFQSLRDEPDYKKLLHSTDLLQYQKRN